MVSAFVEELFRWLKIVVEIDNIMYERGVRSARPRAAMAWARLGAQLGVCHCQ